jgi:hypothetical protein
VTPEDDPSISDDTALYRRIDPRYHLVWDENRGCRRVTSGALSGLEMSVALGDALVELGRSPETLLDRYPDQYLITFPARAARERGQAVRRDPVDDEHAHGLVIGKKNLSCRRTLLQAARWVVAPPEACAEPSGT